MIGGRAQRAGAVHRDAQRVRRLDRLHAVISGKQPPAGPWPDLLKQQVETTAGLSPPR
jgi:hypothetical protein